MAGSPTGKVEIEFTAGSWTDVTAYWDAKRPVTMTGGRSDTDDRVQPGRLSGLMLDNTDGRFTVGNASGAYWPNVASGKRVRFSIKDPGSSTYYARFTGRIDGWPLSWADDGLTCWVTLAATDALDGLNRPPTDGAWLTYAHAACSYYWPMTDAGANHAEHDGGPPMAYSPVYGPAPLNTTPGPPGDPRPLPTGTLAVSVKWGALANPAAADYSDFYAQALLKPVKDAGQVLNVTGGGSNAAAYITADGYLRLESQLTLYGTGTADICDGNWWLFQIKQIDSQCTVTATRINDSTVVSVATIDMVEADASLLAGSRTVEVFAREGMALGHVSWGNPVGGTIASLAEFADAFNGLLADSVNGWGTDCNALFDADVTFTSPASTARVTRRPMPATLLDMWRQVEDSEGGLLHAKRDGSVEYLSGQYRTTGAGVALTLTAADLDPGWGMAADLLKIRNDVTVTSRDNRDGDITVRRVDSASVTRHGRRPLTREVWGKRADVTDERAVAPIADELLQPIEAPRVPTFGIDAMGLTQAQQQALLGTGGTPVGLWSQIGVTMLPTAGGTDSTWLGRVEGWTEVVGIDTWSITFNASFAGNSLGDAAFGLILGANRLG